MSRIRRPYGLWDSPLSPEAVAGQARLNDVQWHPDGGVVWSESRSGRTQIYLQEGAEGPRALFLTLSPRGGIGYGGGELGVARDALYVAEKGRIYRQPLPYGSPRPITPRFGEVAAPTPSPDGRWVLFVHSYEGEDVLAIVDAEGRTWPQIFARGADFYMQPAWHPSGRWVAWIDWDQPNMPWDGACVALARVEGEPPRVAEAFQLGGGPTTPAFQPAFSPDGRWVGYIETGEVWDRLVLYDLETGERRTLLEGGVYAAPAWVQGMRTWGWRADGRAVYVTERVRGFARVWEVEVETGERRAIDLGPYTWIQQLAPAPRGEGFACIASASAIPPRIVTWRDGVWRVHARSLPEALPSEAFAEPELLEWSAPDGTTVYGLYYPPTNPAFEGEGLPPAIVNVHGGPTSERGATFNADAQFFATRGWAVLEVNYRGSTGYGRPYQDALKGHWGEYDVEDAVGGARALAERGLADPGRRVIKGGSAGGYTVLNALIHHPGTFKAGVCLYGVSNLFTLAADTHKFEARYLDQLVGPLPEAADRYRAWSPVYHADRIRDPLAVFQGAEDKVVPPDQAESIVQVLRRRGIPHLYRLYEGEGHGWRRAETIRDYYETLLRFLREHVLFG